MFNRRSKVTVKSKDKCDEVMAENQDLSEDRSKSSPPKDELKKKESDIEENEESKRNIKQKIKNLQNKKKK